MKLAKNLIAASILAIGASTAAQAAVVQYVGVDIWETLTPVPIPVFLHETPISPEQTLTLKLTFSDYFDATLPLQPTTEDVSIFFGFNYIDTIHNVGLGTSDYFFTVQQSMFYYDPLAFHYVLPLGVQVGHNCVPNPVSFLPDICYPQNVRLDYASLSLDALPPVDPVDPTDPIDPTDPTDPTDPGPGGPGTPSDVPEPATLMSLAIGMFGLAAARRRQRAKQTA